MIKYLINKIIGRKENSLLAELKAALKKCSSFSEDMKVSKFYILDSFVYIPNEYLEIKSRIDAKELYTSVVQDLSKDLKKDNVTFFLLCNNSKKLLISLYDPYDYLQKSKVLDIWYIDYEIGKGKLL